jgi:hypothetical protein
MTAHQPIATDRHATALAASERLAARMAELDARFAPERDCSARAMRIVDRVLPQLPVASAYYDGPGFVASARREGERRKLYRITYARLMAKAVPVGPDYWLREAAE